MEAPAPKGLDIPNRTDMVSTMTERTERPESDWMPPSEAAALLGVSTRTLVRLVADGRLRAVKPAGTHRRYLRTDVEALLQQ